MKALRSTKTLSSIEKGKITKALNKGRKGQISVPSGSKLPEAPKPLEVIEKAAMSLKCGKKLRAYKRVNDK